MLRASSVISRVTLQASLGDELAVSGAAVADTAENAELLRDAVKGAIAAVRLEAQNRAPELVGVLRDVKVSVDGAVVRGAGSVPVALVEKLVRDAKGHCTTSNPQHD